MYRTPLVEEMRGQPTPDQWRAGRGELLTMTFEDFEREIRYQLGRMLGAGVFCSQFGQRGAFAVKKKSRQ